MTDYRGHRLEQGFTLLELMVAMVIFALLSIAGWQIMDSLTKSRDRAKRHIEQLSELEYVYLQLSQDFAQVTNYVVMSPNAATNVADIPQSNQSAASPSFSLSSEQVSFIRFANPDPRFNPAPVLAKVQYTISDGKLVRTRFYALNTADATRETPASSALLSGLKDVSWSALTPEAVTTFPDAKTLAQVQQTTASPAPNPAQRSTDNATAVNLAPYQQLPKGVEIKFTYQDEPYVWRFALPSQAPTQVANNGANIAGAVASSPKGTIGTNPTPSPTPLPTTAPTSNSTSPTTSNEPPTTAGGRGDD